MQDDSSRNTIIFLVCALVLFVLYNTFFLEPQQKRLRRSANCILPRRRKPWRLARPH